MSETLVMAPPEPGGWLAERQRAVCTGATALTTYQGMLADEIVLPKSAADAADPGVLVLACNAWVDALLNQAHFLPGEFAPEAFWGMHAHDYLTQALAGGHAQYFANRGGDEIAVRSAQSALKSMLADPHLELFTLMLRLKRTAPKAAKKIAVQNGYRTIAAAMLDLDKRLAALEQTEPLMARQKMWLKSLRKLKLVPDAEMDANLNRIALLNPLFARRRDEAAQVRAEHESTDPAFKAVRSLCEMAGLRFARLRSMGFAPMRSVWPEGPERKAFVYRVETQRGARAALFYEEGFFAKRRLAVLIEQGEALPLGSLALSKDEFAAILPPAPKGG